MITSLGKVGLLLTVLSLFLAGCTNQKQQSDERPATVIQRKLISSRTDDDAIVWSIALRYSRVQEDPAPWVKAAADGRNSDLVRMLCFQAVAERFFKNADVHSVSERLGIQPWWSPDRFAKVAGIGGAFQAGFHVPEDGWVYSMQLPGPPPKDQEEAIRDFIWIAISPDGSVEDICAAALGKGAAGRFVIRDVGVPLYYGPVDVVDESEDENGMGAEEGAPPDSEMQDNAAGKDL